MRRYFYLAILILSSCYGGEDYVEYYPNGNVKLKGVTNKEGEFDGPVRGYYEDGTIRYIEEWKDGKVHGTVEYYYSNGNLKDVTLWQRNQKEGLSKSFYEDGKFYL